MLGHCVMHCTATLPRLAKSSALAPVPASPAPASERRITPPSAPTYELQQTCPLGHALVALHSLARTIVPKHIWPGVTQLLVRPRHNACPLAHPVPPASSPLPGPGEPELVPVEPASLPEPLPAPLWEELLPHATATLKPTDAASPARMRDRFMAKTLSFSPDRTSAPSRRLSRSARKRLSFDEMVLFQDA